MADHPRPAVVEVGAADQAQPIPPVVLRQGLVDGVRQVGAPERGVPGVERRIVAGVAMARIDLDHRRVAFRVAAPLGDHRQQLRRVMGHEQQGTVFVVQTGDAGPQIVAEVGAVAGRRVLEGDRRQRSLVAEEQQVLVAQIRAGELLDHHLGAEASQQAHRGIVDLRAEHLLRTAGKQHHPHVLLARSRHNAHIRHFGGTRQTLRRHIQQRTHILRHQPRKSPAKPRQLERKAKTARIGQYTRQHCAQQTVRKAALD